MKSKEILRKKIIEELENTPQKEFSIQGADAAARLCSSPLWPRYKTVFLFLSIKTEIDTQPLLETSLSEGKKVFAPGVTGDRLVFYSVPSPEGPWRRGPFGIREPGRDMETPADRDFPALVITPGLAYDREGNRLGRGRGYYDKYFAELDASGRSYTAIGLCMDFQILDQIPMEETDKKMHCLLTGKEFKIVREYNLEITRFSTYGYGKEKRNGKD